MKFSRREILVAGAASAFLPEKLRAAEAPLALFDSHIHLVSNDVARYRPAPLRGRLLPGALDVPVTPELALQWMTENNVARAIVIQRTQIYGYDNALVLDAAKAHPGKFAAIICVDAQNTDAPAQVGQFLKSHQAAGIRLAPTGEGVTHVDWLNSAGALKTWDTLAKENGSVCINLRPELRDQVLDAVKNLSAQFAQTPIVIDHMALAGLDQKTFGIDAKLASLSSAASVRFKFSSIVMNRLAAEKIPAPAFLKHWVAHFGAHRLMWGSDIGNTKLPYAQMAAMVRDAISGLQESDRNMVMSGTARTLYAARFSKA